MRSLRLVLQDFAVKRLFEIYKADQAKGHPAWVSELGLAGDLGLLFLAIFKFQAHTFLLVMKRRKTDLKHANVVLSLDRGG